LIFTQQNLRRNLNNFFLFHLAQTPTTTTTSTAMYVNNGSDNTKMSAQDRKNHFANFKKSHISQSTGNLNNRINLSLLSDLQFNDSQFFEVMYVGKIKVSHRKVPETFIDEAIPKFLAHDKLKLQKVS
jgi:hypothetical protein